MTLQGLSSIKQWDLAPMSDGSTGVRPEKQKLHFIFEHLRTSEPSNMNFSAGGPQKDAGQYDSGGKDNNGFVSNSFVCTFQLAMCTHNCTF